MQDVAVKIASFIVLLGGLIFVHELGHFLVAKLLGVKVVRFSIGFGPRLFGFRRGETDYQIAILPLGGYVKMAGDDPTEETAPEDRGRGFLEQAPWRRLLIAVAGPAANFVFPGAIIFALLLAANGSPVPSATVGTVLPESPAARAGLRPGDRIVSVTVPGGEAAPVRYAGDVTRLVSARFDQPVVLGVERDGQLLPPLEIVPEKLEESNELETTRRGLIGIGFAHTPAIVAPRSRGGAGPLEPFDVVVSAGGQPVRHAADLDRLVAAARCAPLDLEVLRETPRPMPGVVLVDTNRAALAAVPTCDASGARAFLTAHTDVSTFVSIVSPGSPAEQAGLRRGDAIRAIDGKPVRTFREVVTLARSFTAGKPVVFSLLDGRELPIVPASEGYVDETTREKRERVVVGIQAAAYTPLDYAALRVPEVNLVRPFGEIVSLAKDELVRVVRLMVLGIARILTGDISSKAVGGPIMLFQAASQAAEEGLSAFLGMMALVSVNLGLVNLLPIPVLDGGHITQAILESVTRRPLSLRAREVANVIGLVLLVSLMIFAFRNDILRNLG